MNVHPQKGKNTIAQQPSGPGSLAPNSSYNQQPRSNNSPYHPYDNDSTQKFQYGGQYLGGAGGAPPRLPLVAGLSGGPNPPLAGTPNVRAGVMPQGPPPGSFVSHGGGGGIDISKQTPHHQTGHHPSSLPPGSMGVNQQIAMANPGHPGIQGRNQGNYQFNNRNPNIRPGNQHMPRPPMNTGGTAINPNHPPNPQPIPYPNHSLTMNQPVLFVINDNQFSNQQLYSYPAAQYFTAAGNMPPGSVGQFQPRAAQTAYGGFRQASPYSPFPIPQAPAVYFQPQQQQTQTSQQSQPQQQTQTSQQSQPQQQTQTSQQSQPQQQTQSVQAVSGPPVVTGPHDARIPTQLQPQSLLRSDYSSGAGGGPKKRSSAIRIVDPVTHRDIITGEEVLVEPATPTATDGIVPVSTLVVAAPGIEEKIEDAPTRIAPIAAEKEIAEVIEAVAVPTDSTTETPIVSNIKSAVVHEVVSTPSVRQENGEIAVHSTIPPPASTSPVVSTIEASSSCASPIPAVTATSSSPDTIEGRGSTKGSKSKRKGSNSGLITTPPIQEEVKVPSTTTELRSSSQDNDVAVLVPVATVSIPTVVEAVVKVEPAVKETSGQDISERSVEMVEKTSLTEKSSVDIVPIESVITNGDNVSSMADAISTPPSAVLDDGVDRSRVSGGKSSSLRYAYKDDQWSPVNPSGKKTYDRNFLLELQNNPASMKKPEDLPVIEVVRDKQSGVPMKRIVIGSDFTPPFLKMPPGKPQGLPKRSSQQGTRGDQGLSGQSQGGPPARKEIKLPSMSIMRQDRPEDPNAWKPKHASKTKEKEENLDKNDIDELSKTVRGILNKLTPSKFEKLLLKIKALNIDTEDQLAVVIKLFFEKAVDEPIFSNLYARMCSDLSGKDGSSSANRDLSANFRKLLLTRCQREFEKDSAGLNDVENKKKEIEANEDESKKKELEDELEDLFTKYRRQSLGNIRFIGELFKLRVLSGKIMHQCIVRLLAQSEDEESLECLCRLLTTVGKDLEAFNPSGLKTASISNRETMNSYFTSLDSIVNKRKISNRIRFMIQDVVDLRKSQWKPRREDNNPKTIEQIHKEVFREREEQERELNNPLNFQGSMGSMSGQAGRDNRGMQGDRRAGDRGDDRNRKASRPNEEGWNTVSNSNRGSTKMDMKQLRIPKAQTGDSDGGISLGPGGRGMGSWGRGASGGMSQSMIGGTSGGSSGGGASQASNRYQLLEDDSGTQLASDGKAPFAGRSSLGGPPQSMSSNVGRSNQDYRTIPGSTKSAFFPPKDGDRDRGFDSSFRPQTPSAPGGRSRSQQSSRENSVTRPQREAPHHPPLVREPSKDLLQGFSTVTEDEIVRKAHSVLGEFFTNENMENAVLDLKEWLHPSTVSTFINECLMYVLERNRKDRKGTGAILKEMVKRKLFTTPQVLKGFEVVLQTAEDFLVDIPKLWEYLAQMIEPIFEDGVVNIGFLREFVEILSPSMAPNFVAATLKELVNAMGGVAGAERLWVISNTSLSNILPGVDTNAFVDQHNELEFIKFDSTSRSTSGVGKVNTTGKPCATSSPFVYTEFQRNLEHFLRGSKRTKEEVSGWILNQPVEVENPLFIRALTTAISESSIDGTGTESKLNVSLFKGYFAVLQRFVVNDAERELQLLFAVQTLVTQRQHPKGLIQGIFDALYDGNVVSEEGFESWVRSEEPSEREGKAVALKSIASFLTWLKEADPEEESDQEADV